MKLKIFLIISEHIKPFYKASYPLHHRLRTTICEIIFSLMSQYRENWNVPLKRAVKKGHGLIHKPLTFFCTEGQRISSDYADLQVFKSFFTPEAQQFFKDLPHKGGNEKLMVSKFLYFPL